MLPAQFSERYVRVYYKNPNEDTKTINELRTSLEEYWKDNKPALKSIFFYCVLFLKASNFLH